ncbi:MAG: hypothetical protein WD035_12165 [Balneolaceae bacterium]
MNYNYIAILDYEHLDNGIFLNAFAQALSQQENTRAIVIHGDSAYTDRLIQTGIVREDAKLRAIKGLNHRLITLLADHAVATIGINGYQRGLIAEKNGQLHVDTSQLKQLPREPLLLLSNLIQTDTQKKPRPLPLPEYARLLKSTLDIEDVYIFNLDEKSEWIKAGNPDQILYGNLESGFAEQHIPKEFRNVPISCHLTTARQFAGFPDKTRTTYIKSGDDEQNNWN